MILWISYALVSAFAAALVTIFIKLGIQKIDPTLAAAIRSVVACFFLVFTSFAMGKFDGFTIQSLYSKDGAYIMLAGLAGSLSWIFYMAALKHGLASQVISVERMSILFVIILSALVLGEALTIRSVIGALFILIGAFLVSTTADMMIQQ